MKKEKINLAIKGIRGIARTEIANNKTVLETGFYPMLKKSKIPNYSCVYTILRKKGVTAQAALNPEIEKAVAIEVVKYPEKAKAAEKEKYKAKPKDEKEKNTLFDFQSIPFDLAVQRIKAEGYRITKTITQEVEL
jgi:hypothetical protein